MLILLIWWHLYEASVNSFFLDLRKQAHKGHFFYWVSTVFSSIALSTFTRFLSFDNFLVLYLFHGGWEQWQEWLHNINEITQLLRGKARIGTKSFF